MGWTGRAYYGTTRKERLEKMLEVYNWEDETRKVETIDSALIGTTAYAAIRRTEKATGETSVTAAVILSHMGGKNELVTKEMGESVGPGEYDCPKRILDKLTATESEWANEWRRKCRERLASKAPDHNVIPRMFIKIVGELLTASNVTAKPHTPCTVYKTPWGYVLTNDETGARFNCPLSLLRNNKFIKVNQIIA